MPGQVLSSRGRKKTIKGSKGQQGKQALGGKVDRVNGSLQTRVEEEIGGWRKMKRRQSLILPKLGPGGTKSVATWIGINSQLTTDEIWLLTATVTSMIVIAK